MHTLLVVTAALEGVTGLALVAVPSRLATLSTRLRRAAEGELDGPLVPAPSTVVG
jgi:hypothetical protein